jgi:hypothetical protein
MTMAPSSGDAAPLVGRDRELAILRRQLDAALGGRGSLVLIGGEAGIGKTALAEAICREAAERGAIVLVGRCYDLTETPPYGPWVEAFTRYPSGENLPPLPVAFATRGTVGAVASQDALFRQVLDFFTALAATRPVVLLLDDLHWSDPASLDLLRFLARSVSALPLLVLVTYRADELSLPCQAAASIGSSCPSRRRFPSSDLGNNRYRTSTSRRFRQRIAARAVFPSARFFA